MKWVFGEITMSRLRLDFQGWSRSDKDEWDSECELKVKAL